MKENSELLQVICEFTHKISVYASEEEVCRQLANDIISVLDLEDCVVYLLNESSGLLHQVAAQGPKSSFDYDIIDTITIRPGYGIVGTVFHRGQYEIVPDTRKDSRYIVGDQLRLSELAVPIKISDMSIGVIDSEHSQLAFYTEQHLIIFQLFANIAANKIEQIRTISSAHQMNHTLEQKSKELLNKNDELEALNAQMDELIYSITHDFRTPILASLGIADMMNQETSAMQELQPMLKASLSKLDYILQSVHLFYRVKRRLVTKSEFSLFEMVTSSLVAHSESLKKFQVKCEIDKGLTVATDSFRLRICLDQLIKNTILFAYRAEKENVLSFKALADNGAVTLRIQDTGPGIPEHVLQSSAQLLRRGNAAGKGLGLGLAIVREAADSGGMNLAYRNIAKEGLLVEIEIPLKEN